MDYWGKRIKQLGIKLALLLFKLLVLFKNLLLLFFIFIKKIFFLLFKIFFKLGGKFLILVAYKAYFGIKKGANKIFLPAKNKFLYPFINKDTIHIVIILLGIIVCGKNFQFKFSDNKRNEEILGNNSILASLAIEELEGTKLIEDKNSSPLDPSLAKGNNYLGGEYLRAKDINQGEFSEDLAYNPRIFSDSEAFIKPFIPSTETPNIRIENIEYIVEAGDAIGPIADKFNVSVNTILWANNLTYYSTIMPGDKLKIPPVSGVIHIVQLGETLSSIAKKYSASAEEIIKYNNLANADSLKKGQEIMVPGGIKRPESRPVLVRNQPGIQTTRQNTLRKIFSPTQRKISAGSRFVWPTTTRRITQYYHLGHHAIDLAAKTGTPIYAIEKGQIILSGWSKGYGNNIIIDHGGGQKSRYGHFSKLYVKNGDFVEKGEQIGEMGSTGFSTGSHLHIEISINGVKVNPLSYLK